ncbi:MULTISPECIES: 2-hydroxyacid dehydrogenase [Agrobacterium]|uniref:2-hydroxyacid dehydrogenase n=1 Tax=Agrobacterium tumefaciens TaxID=358 RepID=UPI000EF2F427|nr:hypothetical protein At1D1108_51220 [Agrobacterium tumefaciens]NSY09861.1 2-hydroxyacid dehydrogenase [Agrobacterium tumefaciens]NSY93447.1 2-hydroxyacid dehydrogenase [Agrobacterium tumefaciens]
MSLPSILIVDPLTPDGIAQLGQAYSFACTPAPDSAFQASPTERAAISCLVTNGGTGARRDLLSTLPNLKLVVVNGVGTDAIDLDYCRRHNVCVTNTPGVLVDDVADLAMGLVLSVARNVVLADRFVRAGRWTSERFALSHKVSGKMVGIFGMGLIGQAVARRAEAFSMEVVYTSRSATGAAHWQRVDDLEALATQSQFLILCAPATPATSRIVDARILNALGPSGYLINVGRGSLVNQNHLLHALEHKSIAGAGLDVFDNEPAIDPRFFRLDNAVLTPHVASATFETRQAMFACVMDNLAAFYGNRPLPTPVDL